MTTSLEHEGAPTTPEALVVLFTPVVEGSALIQDFEYKVVGSDPSPPLLDLPPLRLSALRTTRARALLTQLVVAWQSPAPVVQRQVAPPFGEDPARSYDQTLVRVDRHVVAHWIDVTALHEMSEYYQLLTENAGDVVYRTDLNSVLEWISPSITPVLGFAPSALVGKFLGNIVHPDDAANEPARRQLIEREGQITFDVRCRDTQGVYHWFSLTTRQLRDKSGRAVGRVGSMHPIDAERTALTALERSEEQFRILAENATDVVYRVNREWCIEWVSPSCERVLGYRPDEMIGRLSADFLYEPDLPLITANRERVWRGELTPAVEARFVTKSGALLWSSTQARFIRHPGHEIEAVVIGLRDISAEMQMRQDLTESENNYRLIAENGHDIIYRVNRDEVIEWVSPSAWSVLGYSPEQVVGHNVAEFLHPDDLATMARRTQIVEKIGQATFELRVLDHHGDYHWFATSSQRIDDESGAMIARLDTMRLIDAEYTARQALEVSKEQFRTLAMNATDVVYRVDSDWNIEWISPSVERVLGLTPADCLSRKSTALIYPPDLPVVQSVRTQVWQGQAVPAFEARYVARDGTLIWMSVQARAVRGARSAIQHVIIGLRDVDAAVRARHELEASEESYRLLAENANDVVYRTNAESIVEWISPSVQRLLGYRPEELLGSTTPDLVYEPDQERDTPGRALTYLGETHEPVEIRLVTRSGEPRWVTLRSHPLRDDHGIVVGAVVSLRDSEGEVVARRALATLHAGSEVLLHATSERELLTNMCEAAVADGGYLFAWYATPVHDARHSVVVAAHSTHHADYLDGVDVTWGDEASGKGPTGTALRTGQVMVVNDFLADIATSPWQTAASEHGFRGSVSIPVRVHGKIHGAWMLYAPEVAAFNEETLQPLLTLAKEIGYGLERLFAQVELEHSRAEQSLLSMTLAQSGDAVIVTDPHGAIVYINPATTALTGYTAFELMGANPRILQSGLQDQNFYRELWRTLATRQTWRGTLINRRPDDSLYEADVTISPVVDALGTLTNYVATYHDLSAQRALEGHVSRDQRDRSRLLAILRDVRRGESVEDTADALCRAAVTLDTVDAAVLFLATQSQQWRPLGQSGTDIFDLGTDHPFSLGGKHFDDRLSQGPLLLDPEKGSWPSVPALRQRAQSEGIHLIAVIPVRYNGQLTGLLALGTKVADQHTQWRTRLEHFEEFGTFAGYLLGSSAAAAEAAEVIRHELHDLVVRRRFTPVFQPFVDLETHQVVGYEALTRFDDGVPPDQHFVNAAAHGLAIELEMACATSALAASAHLPAEIFLSLNFSPATLLSGALGEMTNTAIRPLVLEVTEHSEIHDYAALREVIASLPGCSYAVDDAGAGYTSLTHILELTPSYVKIDRSIIAGIDLDPARQAMVIGLCHFAARTNTILIAEGIETQAEADTVRALGHVLPPGALLGQGYLFGRPAPLPTKP